MEEHPGGNRKLSVHPSEELFVLKQPGLWPCKTAREQLPIAPYLRASRSLWLTAAPALGRPLGRQRLRIPAPLRKPTVDGRQHQQGQQG